MTAPHRHGSFSRGAVVTRAVQLGASGALAATLVRPNMGDALAQSTAVASPTAMPDLIRAWLDAWNSTAPATQLAALYAADGVYEDVPSLTHSQGGDVHGFLAPFVKGVGDIKVTPMDAFATADWATLEYTFAGTDRGAIPGGHGKPFSVRIATVFQLRGDKIARSSDYYDSTTIARQLGLVPAPGTPAATPSS